MTRLFTVFAFLVVVTANAQVTRITPHGIHPDMPEWAKMMYSSEDPETVRVAYESYYSQHELVKNRDTQFYKRFMRNYILTGQTHGDVDRNLNEFNDYQIRAFSARTDHEWKEAGPWHYDPEVAMYFEVQSPGAFHAYTVEQAPSNPDVVWGGTATAGAWKSTNKGMNWELMTRNMPITSIYSIAIDTFNEDIVYIGEESGGIWKSTDGGLTWEQTGDASFQNLNHWARDLHIAPDDNSKLFLASSQGLYRSDDAGENWTQVISGNHMEIEFHPANPQIVYAVARMADSTVFRRSTDGGQTFTTGAQGWPTPMIGQENRRTEISVSAASPDRIYVLAAGAANGGEGLYGIYLSTDAGDTFNFMCCGDGPAGSWQANVNPNILGWSEDGSENGGQYYYDLALGASPNLEGRLFAAGINVWRSETSGQNWSLNAHWVTWVGEFTADRYTHADVHDVKFFETDDGVDMWVASDGGIYYSADQGDHLEPRMYGIHGTDFWGWQAGWRNGETMVGGTYHNGTLIKNGDLYHWGSDDALSGGWLGELGGDNFRGFVNPGKGEIGYHDGGSFRFSEDRFTRITGEVFDNSKRPNTGYWYGDYGNLEWDPRCYNCMYSPVNSGLWRTENGGAGWSLVHEFGQGNLISVKVAPRDPNRIYVSHRQTGSNWRIWKSEDGGDNWTDITISSGISGNNAGRPIYLDVDGSDPDRLWAIMIGNQSGNKVFTTTNGGSTWQNITTPTIANEYATSITHQRGTNGGVYLGTNRNVYYRDNSMSDWELYNAELPAITPAPFAQANYCLERIRIAGSRGVYENDFYSPSDVMAAFMADRLHINSALQCTPEAVHFSATSVVACEDATYEWSFPGGQPESTDQVEATVLYSDPGSYDVTLTVTDGNGNSDTFTWQGMITVVNEPISMPLTEDFNAMFPPPGWKVESSNSGGTWEHATDLTDESNKVAQFPNYWVDTEGQADLLVMPALDFSETEAPGLFFDIAFRQFSDYDDGLEVWAKTGSNDEWTVVYSKSGSELQVDDCYMWFWYDLGGDIAWRTDTVDLAMFTGESCVNLAFANIGDYGNHIWIDNVNLVSDIDNSVQEESSKERVFIYPNPSNGAFTVSAPDSWSGSEYFIHDMMGRIVLTGRLNGRMQLSLEGQPVGIYLFFVPGKGHQRIVVR